MGNLQDDIVRAWALFDSGDYAASAALYRELWAHCPPDHDLQRAILMGLIYVQCFTEDFPSARQYANILLQESLDADERHVALHQFGMVERMAGNYPEAQRLFLLEAEILRASFPEDAMRCSANLYEQGYVQLQSGDFVRAEAMLLASLTHASAADDPMCTGCACRALAELAKAQHHPEAFQYYGEQAIAAFREAGDAIAVKEVQTLLASCRTKEKQA